MSETKAEAAGLEEIQAACRKYERITGASVVGLGDTLRILTGPDMAAEMLVLLRAHLAADTLEAKARGWDVGVSEGLRTPPHLAYMLRNPYRAAAEALTTSEGREGL